MSITRRSGHAMIGSSITGDNVPPCINEKKNQASNLQV